MNDGDEVLFTVQSYPQLSSELQQHPELLNSTDSQLIQGLLEGNYNFPNTSALLEQLDTIDNAACGWSRFMSKVGVRKRWLSGQ